MVEYQFTKNVKIDRLIEEIVSAGLSTISHIDRVGDVINIWFPSSLSVGDQTILSGVVDAHQLTTSQESVGAIMMSASEYGASLIRDFGTRNLLLGKTNEQIDAVIDDNPDVIKLGIALLSGSLKYAKRKLQALTPDGVGITQDDIDWMIGEINIFLGES